MQIADPQIPKWGNISLLYVVRIHDHEVLEEKDGQVKIHYSGYSNKYDEWRSKEEIDHKTGPEVYYPFDHHKQLL